MTRKASKNEELNSTIESAFERRAAKYRSASSRSFHAFQSLGLVPAMSAQVSR